jgi:hypothetical protein
LSEPDVPTQAKRLTPLAKGVERLVDVCHPSIHEHDPSDRSNPALG